MNMNKQNLNNAALEGAAQVSKVARDERLGLTETSEHQRESAIGTVATALMQELFGKFPANERASEVRTTPAFKELHAKLAAAIMQQTKLSLAEALQGMDENSFMKFLRGDGLTVGGHEGLVIDFDASEAEPLLVETVKKYFS